MAQPVRVNGIELNIDDDDAFPRTVATYVLNTFNFWFGIFGELPLIICQIVPSVVILALSRHEKPHSPLRTWIVGYLCGCVAILPLIYWGYRVQKQVFSQAVDSMFQDSEAAMARGFQQIGKLFARFGVPLISLRSSLSCFFMAWFVLGCVWIAHDGSSRSDAPQLYWLCVAFLILSGSGYAVLVLLCGLLCCCLPCILCMFCLDN